MEHYFIVAWSCRYSSFNNPTDTYGEPTMYRCCPERRREEKHDKTYVLEKLLQWYELVVMSGAESQRAHAEIDGSLDCDSYRGRGDREADKSHKVMSNKLILCLDAKSQGEQI